MKEVAESPLAEVPIVVLDTETTGLYPGLGHRVVEIAAIRLEPRQSVTWQLTGQINQLVNPGRPMDPEASRVNGITDFDLVQAPPFDSVVSDLLRLAEGAVLVAHNARFDAGFIGMELYIQGLTGRGVTNLNLPNPWLCTLELARRCFHFGHNSLRHVALSLGVRTGRSHRAISDVFTTAEILKRMTTELSRRRLRTVAELLEAQGGAIFTPPPPTVQPPPTLAQALANGQSLRIRYAGQYGATERVIDPLYVTEYQGTAYLIAHCHLRQGQRTFRVDRILAAQLTD